MNDLGDIKGFTRTNNTWKKGFGFHAIQKQPQKAMKIIPTSLASGKSNSKNRDRAPFYSVGGSNEVAMQPES